MDVYLQTLGKLMVNGSPIAGSSRVVLLAYLAIEPERNAKEIGKILFSDSNDAIKLISEHVHNLKKDFDSLNISDHLFIRGRNITAKPIRTDFADILAACQTSDFETIRQLAPGKFLDGIAADSKNDLVNWVAKRERDRVSAIWKVYLAGILNGQLDIVHLDEAYRLTSSVPDSNSEDFVILYEFLRHQGQLSGSLADKMLHQIKATQEREGGMSVNDISSYVRQLPFEHSNISHHVQDRLAQQATHGVSIPEKQNVQAPTETSLTSPLQSPINSCSAVHFLGIGAGLLILFWGLLWPLSFLLNHRGVTLSANQHYSQALRVLQVAQRLNHLGPRHAAVAYNLGATLEAFRHYDQAITAYQQALQYDSNAYPAYNNLARIWLETDSAEAGVEFLGRALEHSHDELAQATILKNLTWARYELGNYDTAAFSLSQALALAPTMAALHCPGALIAEARQQAAHPFWEACVAYDLKDGSVEPSWQELAQQRLMTP